MLLNFKDTHKTWVLFHGFTCYFGLNLTSISLLAGDLSIEICFDGTYFSISVLCLMLQREKRKSVFSRNFNTKQQAGMTIYYCRYTELRLKHLTLNPVPRCSSVILHRLEPFKWRGQEKQWNIYRTICEIFTKHYLQPWQYGSAGWSGFDFQSGHMHRMS